MNKLIILDRDGVINKDSDNYIRSVDEWIPIPGSIEAIGRLNKAGYTLAVATNQSGLARGYFEASDLTAMHQKMIDLVHAEGGNFATIKFCPHGPQDHCACRKPAAGMILEIVGELDVDTSNTWVIGDSLRDLQAGQAAGCRTALVLTGKGERTLARGDGLDNVPVFTDLSDFTDQLLAGVF